MAATMQSAATQGMSSMQRLPPSFPDFDALSSGLNAALVANDSQCGPVSILDRSPALSQSTYPSEVVRCKIGHEGHRKLYCKYGAGLKYRSYGHRGGVSHEAEVYRRVLEPLNLSVAKFYGAVRDGATGSTWLVLEYLDQSRRITKAPQPETIVRAVHWIGRFHAVNEERAALTELRFLNKYDLNYYRGWVRRTALFADALRHDLAWLETLCGRFEEFAGILLSSPLTIIHGEYYPHNILTRDGVIYPIDWESAAIAAGVIDLATLTEAWSPEIVRQCELEYRRARWPQGPPVDFSRTLAAARAYLSFRWLGDQQEWTNGESGSFYFAQLREAAEELGLL